MGYTLGVEANSRAKQGRSKDRSRGEQVLVSRVELESFHVSNENLGTLWAIHGGC